jgi:hypothetical protein
MFTSRVLLIALLALFCGHAAAQGTISAGGTSYVISAAHFDTTPVANYTGVGTGDQVFEAGWFFRIEGDASEVPFPVPTTQNYVSPTATITWANVGGRGFAATKTHTISSGAAGTGEVHTTMSVTNNTGGPITLQLFHAIDFDVNGSAGTDNAILVQPNNYHRINDATTGQCEYRSPQANATLVRAFATTTDVFGLLGDAAVTNFDNSGLPFGPGDYTGGFQFTLALQDAASATVDVYQACNQTATPVTLTKFEVD